MDEYNSHPSNLAKQNINKKVFTNLGDALYNAKFLTKESLFQISDLLHLDISNEDFHRQHYIDEMIEHMENKFGSIVSFLRVNFPSSDIRKLTVLFILVLGVLCELAVYTQTGQHSWNYVAIWYMFISIAISISSISYILALIRNYFVSSSQKNLLKIINLIERSTPEELKKLNHCLYVPLWRKLSLSHPCKFSLKSWLSSGLRDGWTIDKDNIGSLKDSPFQEGLLEILRVSKLKQQRLSILKQQR